MLALKARHKFSARTLFFNPFLGVWDLVKQSVLCLIEWFTIECRKQLDNYFGFGFGFTVV